jgi:CRP-like cAMP-binding protein
MVSQTGAPEQPGHMGMERPGNRLLAALPQAEYQRLESALERVTLPQMTVLHGPDEEIQHVYFPIRGVGSLVAIGPEGEQVDTAIIGNEGMVGLPVFLGTGRMPVEAMVQMDMEALRLDAGRLRAELKLGGDLVNLLQHYTQMVIVELAQLILCNRVHSLEERAARWILQVNERFVGGVPFDVTQEFLASMLGATRPHLSAVLQDFRDRGLLRYGRGNMVVTDAASVELRACACYRTIREELDRLLQGGQEYDITARG